MVRLASIEDAAAVAALVERYWEFEHSGGFDRARVETLLARLISEPQRGACWVAESDEVFVSDELRSAGIGSLLLPRAESDLAGRGMVRLQLQLAVHNESARHFYERHAFCRRAGYELLDKGL